MQRFVYWLAPLALIGLLTGCGSSSSATKDQTTKPDTPKTDDPSGSSDEVTSLCGTLCKSIANRCAGDPTTEFDQSACVDSCTDETDDVLEDADKCVGSSKGCADAVKCREAFGD